MQLSREGRGERRLARTTRSRPASASDSDFTMTRWKVTMVTSPRSSFKSNYIYLSVETAERTIPTDRDRGRDILPSLSLRYFQSVLALKGARGLELRTTRAELDLPIFSSQLLRSGAGLLGETVLVPQATRRRSWQRAGRRGGRQSHTIIAGLQDCTNPAIISIPIRGEHSV